MFTRLFVKDTLERAIATAAEVALGLLSIEGLELATFDVEGFAVAVGVGFLASVLKSLVATRIGSSNNASLVK